MPPSAGRGSYQAAVSCVRQDGASHIKTCAHFRRHRLFSAIDLKVNFKCILTIDWQWRISAWIRPRRLSKDKNGSLTMENQSRWSSEKAS